MAQSEYSPADILSRRRASAIDAAERRTAELHNTIPELEQLDERISELSYYMFVAAGDAARSAEISAKREELTGKRADLLAAFSFPADYDKPVFACKKCGDTGYIKLEKCDCLKELESSVLNKTELGAGLAECTFENFSLEYYPALGGKDRSPRDVMAEILEKCRTYAEYFNAHSGNLLFCGGTGLGKTHLSAAIGHEAARKGYSVVYESAQKIVSECRRALYTSAYDAADAFYDCTLLIIDDLGAEVANDYSISALTELINRRMVLGKPMIISTNLELEKIRTTYGPRLFSRIIGGFIPCVFKGTDVRYQKL
ncbi:MAG: ATP-binding protein [Clostridia bacterium]|nr:ATP-binding protein [Clostridia bacterium]